MGDLVAQIIEGHLFVGAVDNGVLIRRRAFGIFHALRHHPYAQPEKAIQHPHFRGVTVGKIVVHRNHMHGMAGQRDHTGGQGGGEGFAFPGLHFNQTPLQQRPTGLKLAGVMPMANGAIRRLANEREAFAHQGQAKPVPS